MQLYAQPLWSRGQSDRVQRLVAPRDPEPARRFAPADRPVPDGVVRSLVASAVLRWEYRPSSYRTLVWNRSQEIDVLLLKLDCRIWL